MPLGSGGKPVENIVMLKKSSALETSGSFMEALSSEAFRSHCVFGITVPKLLRYQAHAAFVGA